MLRLHYDFYFREKGLLQKKIETISANANICDTFCKKRIKGREEKGTTASQFSIDM